MPVRSIHHIHNAAYVVVGDAGVEEVAHRVHENHPGRPPAERLNELFRNKPKVKTLFVRMSRYAAKTLRERLGIAMRTSGTDLRAPSDRIPGRIRPFDLRVQSHEISASRRSGSSGQNAEIDHQPPQSLQVVSTAAERPTTIRGRRVCPPARCKPGLIRST